MSISFFHCPDDNPPSPTNTHITQGRKDREVVACKAVTHQDVGSNDIRIITDRFHKEYLAREGRQ